MWQSRATPQVHQWAEQTSLETAHYAFAVIMTIIIIIIAIAIVSQSRNVLRRTMFCSNMTCVNIPRVISMQLC